MRDVLPVLRVLGMLLLLFALSMLVPGPIPTTSAMA